MSSKDSTLTQESLKQELRYHPKTGIFTRRKSRGTTVKIGDIAGYITKRGYCRVTVLGIKYQSHRLIFLYMEGDFPPDQVDHINHIKHDNRWGNLRHATSQENSRNTKLLDINTSGMTGVCFQKKANKWRAYIMIGGKEDHLGMFSDFFEACCARKAAEKKYGFHPNHGRAL